MFKNIFISSALLICISIISCTPKLTQEVARTGIFKIYCDPGSGIAPKVEKILDPVNKLTAVLVSPPYREFPNIILFQYSDKLKKWQIIYECLSAGITPETSEVLDLHTLKKSKYQSIDFQVRDWKINSFNDKTKKLISLFNKNVKQPSILIPYTFFYHMHKAGAIPYVIDKTGYYDIAIQSMEKQYQSYPKNSCMMYDLPKILDLKLEFKKDKYIITALTMNWQKWIFSFTGIDDQGYLIDKKISVTAYK